MTTAFIHVEGTINNHTTKNKDGFRSPEHSLIVNIILGTVLNGTTCGGIYVELGAIKITLSIMVPYANKGYKSS